MSSPLDKDVYAIRPPSNRSPLAAALSPSPSPSRFRMVFRVFWAMPIVTKLCTFWLTTIILAAIFADFIPKLADPNYQGFLFGTDVTNDGQSWHHWLGTDNNSRDILSRLIYGTRVSLTVAVTAVAFGTFFGGLLGSFVGYVRGRREAAIMASIDVILAFPALVLLLTVVTLLGKRNLLVISLVVGVLAIPRYARVARANALAISRREFVAAARAIGTKDRTILWREVIPNVMPTVFAYALVAAAVTVVLEGTLAFLGLSVQAPTPSWGVMINASRADLRINIWPVIWPSLMLVFTVYSLNNVGDWFRIRTAHKAAAL